MSYYSNSKVSLKVVVNKEKTKVLFAEANSDFINVLLSFLALPLGKVVQILNCNYGTGAVAVAVPGSLNTLYTGLLNLDKTYFSVGGARQMLLNPQSSSRAEFRKLALDISDSPNNQFSVCPDLECRKLYGHLNISLYSDIATCKCGKSLSTQINVGEPPEAGVFTISPLSFIITDNLRIAPIVYGTIQTLTNLGITDTQGAEIMFSSFDLNEVRNLLKFSLTSATPLTEMILKKAGVSFTPSKPEPGIMLHHTQKNAAQSRKMVLRVCLQKSTNKFLFAEAMDEFVEFLFSFMTVPLGGVEFLLGGNTGLENIDNLYRSVSNGIDQKYFTTSDRKNRLINPKLPHGYRSNNQFLPLSEDSPPKLYYQGKYIYYEKYESRFEITSFNEKDGKLVSSFKSSKDVYVKKQTMCFVKDDLTVSPSLATNISILSGLGVPLSDVKEMELQIGLEEALNILKASLTSKTALTDGLIKPMLNKLHLRKPKQEC